MNTTHISLVGGQPVPEYIAIMNDTNAQSIYLVCSPESMAEAERLADVFGDRVVRPFVETSPVDLADIEEKARHLLSITRDNEVTLNLTSGTKLWAMTFYRVFMEHPNVHFVYVDQNNLQTDLMTRQTIEGSIDPNMRFRLYGARLTGYRRLSDYTQADFDVVETIKKARRFNVKAFSELTKDASPDNIVNHKLPTSTKDGKSHMEYDVDSHYVKLTLTSYRDDTKREFEFSSPNVFSIVFNSGWLELKTAKNISSNKGVVDVWLNCSFADSKGDLNNEIDVIADMGNRLYFFECKTSVFDATDIDKFSSAVKNFAGTSTKGVFVVNDAPSKKNDSRYQHAIEKCADNNILTFNYTLWENDPVSNRALNVILNTQLNTQNKR